MRNRRRIPGPLRRVLRGRAKPAGGVPRIPERELAGLDDADRRTIERSFAYTMTGVARLRGLVAAVRHCVAADLPGAFAECGVWRGGSVLAMVSTLQAMGVDDRDVYLYDTFEGMTEPTEHDRSEFERPALETWREAEQQDGRAWSVLFDPEAFNEDAVRELLTSTGYPPERLHFVRGRVEETIPATAPDQLALVRLDTDWYESTLHEMQHLYPRLAEGGVLIVDDYGHWQGARRAVDDYFAAIDRVPLLTPLDYSARLAVKP
jgi:O-methyltransferase